MFSGRWKFVRPSTIALIAISAIWLAGLPSLVLADFNFDAGQAFSIGRFACYGIWLVSGLVGILGGLSVLRDEIRRSSQTGEGFPVEPQDAERVDHDNQNNPPPSAR